MVTETKSLLYKLEPIIKRWPAVTKPEGHVHFRSKLTWTTIALMAYFVMGNVDLYGLASGSTDVFAQFRAILAGASGSIIHLGIGPIVTASIIMQLFVGAKIINLDLKKSEDKAIYQGSQKLLVIVMIIVESIPQVYGFLEPDRNFVDDVGLKWARTAIVVQLAVGSYLVFLMDETVSKWGIGSGISLFIAAGVAQSVFTGVFNWVPSTPGAALNPDWGSQAFNAPAGMIPKTIYLLKERSTSDLVHGQGFDVIFLQNPNPISAFVMTALIFVIVVYAQSSRIELPLSHGKVRGARGRYPIKLMYVSNIPVILMSALLANVNLMGLLLWSGPLKHFPLLGGQDWIGGYQAGSTQATSGVAYYTSAPQGLGDWLLPLVSGGLSYRTDLQIIIHILVYLVLMVAGSIVFAKFWVETANMGPDAMAKQIESSGMQIPGFRRDPRIVERILERYIPAVTIISGAAVGLLAATADVMGTIGQVGGTGVLLTIGILHQMYEAIAKEQVMEMHPVMRGFFGG